MAKNISFDESGCGMFDVIKSDGSELGHFTLKVPGVHNVSNALAAIALGEYLKINTDTISRGLMNFGGTDRRFQYKGKLNDATIIDDYAHHPTEIRATLNAARNYTKNRIICVFQPHTYTRTKAFFDDFVDALSLADVTVLADIYAAREKDTLGMHSSLITDELKKKGCESYYFDSFEKIEEFLIKNSTSGDLLITMGAGDVVKIGDQLLNK